MNCTDCRSQLIDYHYEELPDADRKTIAEHLAHCGECAVEYCRLHAELNGISGLLEDQPSPRVLHELKAEVRRRKTQPPSLLQRLMSIRIPLYQPALIALSAGAIWLFVAYAPVETNQTQVEEYDARTTEIVDLNLL